MKKLIMKGAVIIIKQIAAFVLCGAISFSTAFAGHCETQTITEETNVPQKTVFLGDSIAAGVGLDGYSKDDLYNCDSYANILGEKYKSELNGKCNAVMENKAVSGEESKHLLDHLKNGDFDEALKNSCAVVISIGGNDILNLFENIVFSNVDFSNANGIDSVNISPKGILSLLKDLGKMSADFEQALNRFDENIDQIVKCINNKTNGVIIIQTIYNPLDGIDKFRPVTQYISDKINNMNNIIKDNSESDGKERYVVCDVAQSFSGRGDELTNINDLDIHPNSDGHRIIAQCVDGSIRSKTYTYERTVEITAEQETKKDNKTYIILIVCIVGAAVVIIYALKRIKS